LEGCWFESLPMLDGNGVKAMPGSILAPNPGSFNNLKERKYKLPNLAHQKILEKMRLKALLHIRFPHEFSALHCDFL